jgi:hypothetical protein
VVLLCTLVVRMWRQHLAFEVSLHPLPFSRLSCLLLFLLSRNISTLVRLKLKSSLKGYSASYHLLERYAFDGAQIYHFITDDARPTRAIHE